RPMRTRALSSTSVRKALLKSPRGGAPLQSLALVALLVATALACSSAPPPRSAAAPASQSAPSAAAPAASTDEWDRAVAEARREGKVVVAGPQGELYRESLRAFNTDFPDIQLDYTPMNGRDFWPRLRQER